MQFEAHIRDWEEMAADPFWAVLTGKRHWDTAEFFATGETDVRNLLGVADQLGLLKDSRARALDFGCGVGRITRQLALHFEECHGVDVSKQMLEIAAKYNPSCHFHLNLRKDLSDFPDSHFDLVYTVIVLQHQPNREVIESYIREFIRVLRPQGLLAFHLPSKMPFRYRLAPRRRVYKLLHSAGVRPERLRQWRLFPMKMTAVPQKRVMSVIRSSGGRLLLTEPHGGSGPIPSIMYYCTRD
jgi:SAM-dependent methyltransferase